MSELKLDKADMVFSQYIRLRDKKCLRCGSLVEFNEKGLPTSHQNSHFYGRGKESTRFDEENCDTLCLSCHQEWGTNYKMSYRAFKIRQLGKERFSSLTARAHKIVKKNRRASLLRAKELLKTLEVI